MTFEEFQKLKKKYRIYDNAEEIFDFVSELLHRVAREVEQEEPYAVNTIKRLDDASRAVSNLIEYVWELEIDEYSDELEEEE